MRFYLEVLLRQHPPGLACLGDFRPQLYFVKFFCKVILRKVSKFLTGSTEDAIMPIPCFYDVVTGKVLVELLPKELREEYTKLNEESK